MPAIIERLVPNLVINNQLIDTAAVLVSAGEDIHAFDQKSYIVYAIAAGAPGNLNAFVEIHPDPSGALSAVLGGLAWAQLGAAQVLAPGVGQQTLVFPFVAHAEFSRINIQAPGAGVGATWTVFVVMMAR